VRQLFRSDFARSPFLCPGRESHCSLPLVAALREPSVLGVRFAHCSPTRETKVSRPLPYSILRPRTRKFSNSKFDLLLENLCPGRDSNSHGLLHTILSRARKPFRHPGVFHPRTRTSLVRDYAIDDAIWVRYSKGMARVISVFNMKGGVGKTTTAMSLSSYLALLGKRTLMIDFDAQANATSGLGVECATDETIYHALLAGQASERVIKTTHLTNLEVVPASAELSGALVELVHVPKRERKLREFVDGVCDRYEFVIIDLGPSLNLLTINGLVAADEVLVPIQCEYYSLEGVGQLLSTIDLIRNNLGHPLKVAGAVLTMYDKREKIARDVAEEVRKKFPHHVYRIVIPRSVALAEAPSFRRSVILYSPQSPGAVAYEALAKEVIAQGEEESGADDLSTDFAQGPH
jgi:chromosome partitioning protein